MEYKILKKKKGINNQEKELIELCDKTLKITRELKKFEEKKNTRNMYSFASGYCFLKGIEGRVKGTKKECSSVGYKKERMTELIEDQKINNKNLQKELEKKKREKNIKNKGHTIS